MPYHGFAQKSLALLCSAALAASCLGAPGAALADDDSSKLAQLQSELAETAQKVEEATTTYQAAEQAVSDLQDMIQENEDRAAEIEAKLPEQRERTAKSIKALYLFQQSSPGLLDLILSAESFNEFIATVSYIDAIHERNTEEVARLASMSDELADRKAELSLEYDVAEQKQAEALEALNDARTAKRSLQQQADEIAAAEEAARAEAIAAAQREIEAAQEAARQEAEQKAQQEQEQQEQEAQQAEEEKKQEEEAAQATFTTSSGNEAPVEVPEESASASTEPLTSNTTAQESSGWAARIDAYLAGSPLAGYGSVFAEAAAKYGVDPRLSPAISCVESSKGAVCFLPHNAWGWGSSSWSDWTTAINAHVAGLAANYGGTLTLEGAKRYCPPTYQQWYSSVLAEMNSI